MKRIIAAQLGALLIALSAAAQSTPANPEQNWDNLRSLRAREKIQLIDQKLKSQSGVFRSYSEESIVLEVGRDKREVTIPRTEVFRINAKSKGHPRLRNAFIGLGVGAVFGSVVGSREAGNPDWPAGAEGAAIGAGLFAPLGAGIGAILPTGSHTVYRADRSAPTLGS
jgi:hypothetical protein